MTERNLQEIMLPEASLTPNGAWGGQYCEDPLLLEIPCSLIPLCTSHSSDVKIYMVCYYFHSLLSILPLFTGKMTKIRLSQEFSENFVGRIMTSRSRMIHVSVILCAYSSLQ